jgi:pimeloyl-ACP methyl ester carboxylesterase
VSLLKELGELDEYKSKIFEETSRQNPSRQYVMSSIINNFENNLLDDNALFAIKCGTLIIWGSNDKVIPSAMGHILAGKLNGSALEIVEDGGHVPHILKPNKVASILKQFIDDM